MAQSGLSTELKQAIEPELKTNIRQFIISLLDENNAVRAQLLALKNQYLDTAQLGSYHDINTALSGRFAHVSDNGSYYMFKLQQTKMEDGIYIKLMYQLYLKLTQIIQTNILNSSTLSYSFYYRTPEGQMLHITTDHIPEEAIELSFSGKALQVGRSSFEKAFRKEIEKAKKRKSQTDFLTKHYDNLLATLNSSKKISPIKVKYNQGHVLEALERDIMRKGHRKTHQWTPYEAWDLLKISMGNDPWYSGGDLLSAMYNIQIKSFATQKETKWSGKVGITSFSTLEDILNYLLSLIDVDTINIEKKVEEAYRVFMQRDVTTFDKIAQRANITTEELINMLSGKGLSNI